MSPARLVLVLCLIAISMSACARRAMRVMRLPSVESGAAAQKPGRGGAAHQLRDARRSLNGDAGRSLKIEVGQKADQPDKPIATAHETSGAAVRPGAPRPDQGGVGTASAWSVENRNPNAPPGASYAGTGPPPPGRLLSRARSAVRHAGGGTWAGVLALCAAAAAAVVALAVRRSRHAA